ncbi:MAG: family 43 glycosylhydrolase, partial [Acidimicrobiales bacterium]
PPHRAPTRAKRPEPAKRLESAKPPKPSKARRRHRLLWAVVVMLVLGMLTYGLVDDLRTQTRLHHTQLRLSDTRSTLEATARLLSTTEQTLAMTVASRDLKEKSLNQLSGELAAAEESLSRAQSGLALQSVDIATLDTCVAGVQAAVGDLSSHNQSAAVKQITQISQACEKIEATGPGAPVYPFDFPDPDVIDVGGTYYAYATNAAGGNVQVIESKDLSQWKMVGDALPNLASWATPGNTWAPAVIEHGGAFLMYYAARFGSGAGSNQCISVARSSKPRGPFVDSSSSPLVCQGPMGGSIDPDPYTDTAGNLYLAWKSNGGPGPPSSSPTIWAQQLVSSGTAFTAGTNPTELVQPTQGWEGGVVEGPDMWPSAGSYYLFYSANDWNTASYAIGVAVCSGPIGPCTKPSPGPLYASQTDLLWPGGPSVFEDSSGQTWIAFHAWLPGAVGYPNARLLFLRHLAFSGTGALPAVEGPG